MGLLMAATAQLALPLFSVMVFEPLLRPLNLKRCRARFEKAR
jgi:hypothetical protein